MSSRQQTRAVGAWLAIGADALFLAAMTFTCFHFRWRATSAGLDWPDTPHGGGMGPILPYAAAGLVLLAAWLLRVRFPRVIGFLLLAAALGLMALFWHQAQRRGVTIGLGQYAASLYLVTIVWTLHVIGAFVFVGLFVRRTEVLRVLPTFLLVVGLAGVLSMSAILL